MIFRRGKWDLPKGKLDKGETLEQCALREVEEETGLSGVQLSKPTTITYHTYDEFGKHILKESHWFKMKYTSDKKPVPQQEEDITKIEWVHQDDLELYMENTFGTIKEVLSFLKKKNPLE
jgi:8-oxo-dGTP pyrophosphatase MutT (NUDIX family)